MANSKFAPAICILAALFFAASTIASSDAPFIVAHKKASLTRLKSGSERVSVSIDIYNQGYALFKTENFVIDFCPKWTVLSHSFELEAKTRTVFYGAPAVITFRVPTKAALQEAYSTPILPLDVLADRPPEKKFDWRLLAKYGSCFSDIYRGFVCIPGGNSVKIECIKGKQEEALNRRCN
ncbi:UNVERIFIED_CONTAM: hypothetical protein Sradi_3030600 [Sesamum radiatum]|uniref:Late embryogenesis abundant protein LEA-2 subgroup domain-containing protein n=1 Tax=Sesamum radiatum TaxID=300843 RepID=A0AAW2RBS4_SESRA